MVGSQELEGVIESVEAKLEKLENARAELDEEIRLREAQATQLENMIRHLEELEQRLS